MGSWGRRVAGRLRSPGAGNRPGDEPGRQDQSGELAGKLAARMLPQVFSRRARCLSWPLRPSTSASWSACWPHCRPRCSRPATAWAGLPVLAGRRKDEVNASEVKIGADELPAVTQPSPSRTWWTSCPQLAGRLVGDAPPGQDLPRAADLPAHAGRRHTGGRQVRRLARPLADFKLLDPCCGSGHFLVAAFLLLVPMRMAAEGLSAMDAVDAVLAHNLHGLELDARCVEIAVFAPGPGGLALPGRERRPAGRARGYARAATWPAAAA